MSSPRRSLSSLFAFTSLTAIVACGAPPPAPVAPARPISVATEPPPDVSAVPEPAGLMVVARVARPDGILKTVGGWAHLPLPGGADLVRSIADDGVADAVDLGQPVDAAVALGGSARSPKPLIAVAVAVRSFDDAKAKIGAKHKMTAGKNGDLVVEGIGASGQSSRERTHDPDDDDDDDDSTPCVLTHASSGARLVCGERAALDVLAPYLARTMPRQKWTSDVHVEMTLAALQGPLAHLRGSLPMFAKSMLGASSPALAQLIEAGVDEVVDVVGDVQRLTMDAQVAAEGLKTTMKVDYAKTASLTARLGTAHPERADVPPPAFLHLPAETDLALYGRGSDAKLFDHVRELVGNLALETGASAGMPAPERQAVRDIVERMFATFTNGGVVYGKGYDAIAVDKAIAARKGVKTGDVAAQDEADRILAEQALGWHLVQVSDPITKVGPMLKDWSTLWNRPAFVKWAKAQVSGKMLAQVRIAPAPSAVVLPRDTVHLEVVIPRADLEGMPEPKATVRGAASPKPTKGKKIPVKPLVFHVLAVPDQGGTWIGLGMDAKLVAQKAEASLSTAPDGPTLGKTANAEALRDVKASSAILATLRGFLVFTALDRSRPAFAMLGALPSRGQTPIVMTAVSQGPSSGVAAGSVVGTFTLPRGAIEDIVKLAISNR